MYDNGAINIDIMNNNLPYAQNLNASFSEADGAGGGGKAISRSKYSELLLRKNQRNQKLHNDQFQSNYETQLLL